jgi:hypothetical protein
MPDGGEISTYIASKLGAAYCTSGTMMPVWPKGGRITDNDCTWTFGTTYFVTIGRWIWFESNSNAANVPSPTGALYYGTAISGNAIVQNAFLDTEWVSFAGPGGAAIRLSAGQPIDFSGNLTRAGQNLHILEYSDTSGALTYTVRGMVALSVADSSLASFHGQIQSPLITPKSSSSPCVTGTRTADSNYEYVCVSTKTWKRSALSAF